MVTAAPAASVEVVLRPMAPGDLTAVAAIEHASATVPWSLETFAHELGIPFSRALVGEAAGEVVGYAVWWRVADVVHLLNLAVASGHRNRGIGRRLLAAVEADAVAAGAASMALEVASDNAPALGLYRSVGFVPVGERRDYYGAGRHAVTMTRPLPG